MLHTRSSSITNLSSPHATKLTRAVRENAMPPFHNCVQTRPCRACRIQCEWETNASQISTAQRTKPGERMEDWAPTPSFPPVNSARHFLCSVFYLTEIKVLIAPFLKMMSLFFLALAESKFITNLLCDWWLWRDKAEGKTHLEKVWNSRDRLTIRLAERDDEG